jgi:hypothetical protein
MGKVKREAQQRREQFAHVEDGDEGGRGTTGDGTGETTFYEPEYERTDEIDHDTMCITTSDIQQFLSYHAKRVSQPSGEGEWNGNGALLPSLPWRVASAQPRGWTRARFSVRCCC